MWSTLEIENDFLKRNREIMAIKSIQTSVYKIKCNLGNVQMNPRKTMASTFILKWQNCSVGLKYKKLNRKSKWNNKSEKIKRTV